MLTWSEDFHDSEISMLEMPTSQTDRTSVAVVSDIEIILKEIKDMIQVDIAGFKLMFVEANEKTETLANEMVPKSELLLAQQEIDRCQEMIRAIEQQHTCSQRIAQVTDTKTFGIEARK